MTERGAPRAGLALVAASLALFLVDLDFFALNLALPAFADELGVSVTDLQWVISGYMLALGAFLIPGGRLGDILGRRRTLIFGLLVFCGASTVCGVVDSAQVVIAFRVVQGIGAAIIFPICVAVVTNAFPERRRKRAIGNLYGLAAVATAVGPFFGGFFTEAVSWRAVFLVNVPLGLAAIGLALWGIRESRDETVPRRIDFAGLTAVAVGIAAITFGVDGGEDHGWGSAEVLGPIIGGLVLLAIFVAIEARVRFPLIDLSLFRNLPYVAVTLLGMVANTAFVVTTFSAAIYLQQTRGLSPIEAGAVYLAASVTVAMAGPLSGRLGERFDVPPLMASSMLLGAAALLVISFDTAYGVYVPALLVMGFGYGLCWALASVGTQTVVPAEKAGAASGVTLAIVIGVAGLAVAVVTAVIDGLVAGGTSQGDAIEAVWRVAAISSALLGVALGLTGRLTRRQAPAG
ncbi:MAG: MFS transporter [Solirubrobacterales bacterium]|nr:MFS transporter [Solirubrobacterales bacterium]